MRYASRETPWDAARYLSQRLSIADARAYVDRMIAAKDTELGLAFWSEVRRCLGAPRERDQKRVALIREHYEQSGSMEATGRAFGVTRQRVSQILGPETPR